MELDGRLTEAQPAEHPAHVAVALGHGLERIDDLAVDQRKSLTFSGMRTAVSLVMAL